MNHSTKIIGAISKATDNKRNELDKEVNNDCQIISKPEIETRMLEKEHNTTIQSEATADEMKRTELEDAHASEDVDNIILSDANRTKHVSVEESILEEKFAEGRKDVAEIPSQEMEAEDSKLVNEITSIAQDIPNEPHKTLNCKSEVENLKVAKEGSGEGENFLNLSEVSADANNGSPDAREVMELPDQTKRDVCDIQSVQEEKIENRPVEIVATQETSSEELQQNVVQVSPSLDKVEDTPLVQAECADATAELIVEDSAEKPGESLDVSEALHDATIVLDDETIKICQKANDDSRKTIKLDGMMDKEYDTTILSDRMIKTCQEVNDDQEKTSNSDENKRQTIYREAIPSEATTNETVVKVCQETTEPDITHPLEEEKDRNGPSIDDKSGDLCSRDLATSLDDSEAPLEVAEEKNKEQESQVNDDCQMISKPDDIETRMLEKEHVTTILNDDKIKIHKEMNDTTSKPGDLIDKEENTTILSEAAPNISLHADNDQNINGEADSIDTQLMDREQNTTIQPEATENETVEICQETTYQKVTRSNESTKQKKVLNEGKEDDGPSIDAHVKKSSNLDQDNYEASCEDQSKETESQHNNDRKVVNQPDDIQTRMMETEHDTTIQSEDTVDEITKMIELEDAHASEDVDNIILSDANRIQHVSVVESILEEKVAEGRKYISEIPSQEANQ